MTIKRFRWIQVALAGVLVLSLGAGLTQSAQAQAVFYGDTVASGEVVDNDLVLRGDQISVDGEVLGDVFAAGKNITVNGKVHGSLFVLGEKVSIGGQVDGSLYSLASQLEFNDTSVVARNVYFVGIGLTTAKGAAIGRDLYTLTLGARISGEVARNIKAVIGPIEIIRLLFQSINVGMNDGNSAAAFAFYPRLPAAAMTAGLLPQALSSAAPDEALAQAEVSMTETGKWLLGKLRELVGLLVVGLLLAWLFPARLQMWSERARARPMRASASGIVVLITGFSATAILAAIVVGIALGLNAITLENLAFLVATLGLLAIGLAFFVFWLLVAYVSKIVVGYMLGRLILNRFAPKLRGRVWPLLLGLLIYVLVTAIPYFGWVVGLIVTLLGLGAIWLVYIDWRSGPDTDAVLDQGLSAPPAVDPTSASPAA